MQKKLSKKSEERSNEVLAESERCGREDVGHGLNFVAGSERQAGRRGRVRAQGALNFLHTPSLPCTVCLKMWLLMYINTSMMHEGVPGLYELLTNHGTVQYK